MPASFPRNLNGHCPVAHTLQRTPYATHALQWINGSSSRPRYFAAALCLGRANLRLLSETALYIIDIQHLKSWWVMVMERAKLFWSGRSQAVRLPKDFRFAGEEVRIRRHGSAVILEPVAEDWAWLDSIAGKLDEDFVQAVQEGAVEQERPALEKLFR